MFHLGDTYWRLQRALLPGLLLSVLLPAGAMAAEKPQKQSPKPEFRTCSQSMDITDVRFSSRAEVGVEVVFDDIGCAVIWRNLQCAMDQMAFDSEATTRDFNDLSILRMSEAFYVVDKTLRTPIGFGIAAFRDSSNARAFMKKRGTGRLLSYKELIRLDLKPPEPPEEEDE